MGWFLAKMVVVMTVGIDGAVTGSLKNLLDFGTFDPVTGKQTNAGNSRNGETTAGVNLRTVGHKLESEFVSDKIGACRLATASVLDTTEISAECQAWIANADDQVKVWKAAWKEQGEKNIGRYLNSQAADRLHELSRKQTTKAVQKNEKKLLEELQYKAKYLAEYGLSLPKEDQKRMDKLRKHYKTTLTEKMSNFYNGVQSRGELTSTLDDDDELETLRDQEKRRTTHNFKSTLTGGRAGEARGTYKDQFDNDVQITGDAADDALLLSAEQQEELQDDLDERKAAAKRLVDNDDDPECKKERCKASEKWAKDQNENNIKKIQEQAARAVAMATEMQDKMQVKRDQFNQVVQEERDKYYRDTQKLMEKMREPIPGMDIQMEPGGGVVNGDFIEPSGWELEMTESDGPSDWANAGPASDDSVSSSDDMLDLLVKECYRGISLGNKKQVDKNCATADILTYKCETPIDASFYIGVSFDITEGYTPTGFRAKLIKHWCREMNTYKGQFDIPDGMHIQGVYDTTVETTVSESQNDFFNTLASEMTETKGDTFFGSGQESSEDTGGEATSITAGGSGSTNGGANSGGASFTGEQSEGEIDASSTFRTNKTFTKLNFLKRVQGQAKNQFQHMYAKMDVNVIRYEMFLREVSPKWLHEDFLDCFMMLPNSFYAPKAPQKFSDFIARYGTHYVHSARFGGQLSVIKKKTILDGMTLTDVKEEAQQEMDNIVGQAANKHKANETRAAGAGGAEGGGGGGVELEVKATASQGKRFEASNITSSQNGTVNFSEVLLAGQEIQRERFRRSSTYTSITAIGGSHNIAQVITDLYSPTFRSNLVKWLDSIPYYPKPFEPKLEPITNMMKHLIDNMVDPQCYTACIVNKEENCIKDRTVKIGCLTVFADQSELCKPQCVNASTDATAECDIPSPRVIDCYDVVEIKQRMKRKVEALHTALTVYMNTGLVTPETEYEIPKSNDDNCETAYHGQSVTTSNEADQNAQSDSIDWKLAATEVISVQFTMQSSYFNVDNFQIDPFAHFYALFDQNDRRWYTVESQYDRPIPEFASPPVPFNQLQTVAKDPNALGTQGDFVRIPKKSEENGLEFGMIRLVMGLWVEVNLNDGDLHFTKRCLEGMQAAQDPNVKNFLATYEDLLVAMAAGTPGQKLGMIEVIESQVNLERPKLPCDVRFDESQMYDGANDVQQCVKVTVQAKQNYYFVMAVHQEVKDSWIYVHQAQDSLCLHKLSKDLKSDTILRCADRYATMSSGHVKELIEQLYICTHRQDNLLTISLARPSYNRQDRENALTIFTHSMIQGTRVGDPVIMPRYYGVGAGAEAVFVKSIYMTEIDDLQCQAPFIKKAFGGSFRCALDCHPECSIYGCKKPNDDSACVTCKNSKLVIRRPRRQDVSICVPSCGNRASDITYEIGIDTPPDTIITSVFIDPGEPGLLDSHLDPATDTQQICMNCHPECNGNCKEKLDSDCVKSKTVLCKNYRWNSPDLGNRCLAACPLGTYVEENTIGDFTERVCQSCDSACVSCAQSATRDFTFTYDDDGDPNTAEIENTNVALPVCQQCKEGYLSVLLDTSNVACLDMTDDTPLTGINQQCPDKYVRSGDTCDKDWKVIGYQKLTCPELTDCVLSDVVMPPNCQTDDGGCNVKSGTGNFLRMGTKTEFDRYQDADTGDYAFQLAWKVDACTVAIMEWEQNYNPLWVTQTDAQTTAGELLPTADQRTAKITSFRQIKCIVDNPDLANMKKISFQNREFFIHCPRFQITQLRDPITRHHATTLVEHDGSAINIANPTFNGLKVATGDAATSLLNNDQDVVNEAAKDFFRFGFTSVGTDRREKSFLVPNDQCSKVDNALGQLISGDLNNVEAKCFDNFYSEEFQLSVHDRRAEPIGWSKWHPNLAAPVEAKAGTVATYVNRTWEVANGGDGVAPADLADYDDKCVIDCDTGEKMIRRSRVCQCLPPTRTTIISDTTDTSAPDYDAEFATLCQPCGPPEEAVRIDTCTTNPCVVEPPQTSTTKITALTKDYMHWQCCGTKSTAIRVMGMDPKSNSLGLNGVYELMYDQQSEEAIREAGGLPVHRYKLLYTDPADSSDTSDPAVIRNGKNIYIERYFTATQDTNEDGYIFQYGSYWTIKVDNVVFLASGYQADTPNVRIGSECPQDGGVWTIENDVDIYGTGNLQMTKAEVGNNQPRLSITCAEGREKCPITHPYSFNHGRSCCSTPFKHYGIAFDQSGYTDAEILNPNDGCDATYNLNLDSDSLKASCLATENGGTVSNPAGRCLGLVTHCPYYSDEVPDPREGKKSPCRTNLDRTSGLDPTTAHLNNFMAGQASFHKYDKVVLCTDLCSSTAWQANPDISTPITDTTTDNN